MADAPRLRLTVEFHEGDDVALLAWTIRQIIDALKSSPVPITVRFERFDD